MKRSIVLLWCGLCLASATGVAFADRQIYDAPSDPRPVVGDDDEPLATTAPPLARTGNPDSAMRGVDALRLAAKRTGDAIEHAAMLISTSQTSAANWMLHLVSAKR